MYHPSTFSYSFFNKLQPLQGATFEISKKIGKIGIYNWGSLAENQIRVIELGSGRSIYQFEILSTIIFLLATKSISFAVFFWMHFFRNFCYMFLNSCLLVGPAGPAMGTLQLLPPSPRLPRPASKTFGIRMLRKTDKGYSF